MRVVLKLRAHGAVLSEYTVVKDDIKPRTDEQGIVTIGIFDFLLNETILEQI